MLSSGDDMTGAFFLDEDVFADDRDRPPDSRATVERVLITDYVIFQRMALKQIGNRADADDVLQSFCVKALERAHQLRNADAVHGWLRRLFQTTLLDHFRRSSRLRAKITTLEQSPCVAENIVGEALTIDEAGVIEDVLPRLRPSYAQIIRQMDLGRDEPSTIAATLDISPNNLAVRLHRARNAFREALAETPVALQA